MTRWVGKHAFPVSPKITSQSMRMGLEINSLSIVSYVHVNWVTFNDLEENHSLGPCYSLNLSVLHRLMCLNTQSLDSGTMWEGCRTFGFCGSISRSELLRPGFKVF